MCPWPQDTAIGHLGGQLGRRDLVHLRAHQSLLPGSPVSTNLQLPQPAAPKQGEPSSGAAKGRGASLYCRGGYISKEAAGAAESRPTRGSQCTQRQQVQGGKSKVSQRLAIGKASHSQGIASSCTMSLLWPWCAPEAARELSCKGLAGRLGKIITLLPSLTCTRW